MTEPKDRTKSVVDTRHFLETLVTMDEGVMWDLVRTLALMLLRHYPQNDDITKSAIALPSVWSMPSANEEAASGSARKLAPTSLDRFSRAPYSAEQKSNNGGPSLGIFVRRVER